MAEFDESKHPRDKHGKFTVSDQDARIDAVMKKAAADPSVLDAEARVEDRGDTRNDPGVLDANGNYTPQADAENRRIADSFLDPAALPKPGEVPVAVFMVGRPGAGKSTALEQLKARLPPVVMINSDDIKAKLPEYDNALSPAYHERSVDIARSYLTPAAIGKGYNVVFDMTDNKDRLERSTALLKAAGYHVVLIHADVDQATSLERVYSRFKSGGRYVPLDVVKSYGNRPQEAYDFIKQKGIANEWYTYDNNGSSPILKESGGQGRKVFQGRSERGIRSGDRGGHQARVRAATEEVDRFLAEFDEGKHPRDAKGRFAETGGFERAKPWIGVDFDGTLAQYDHFRGLGHTGEPIPAMVKLIKQHLADGETVKIFTARIGHDPHGVAKKAIDRWTEKHIGQRLPITNVKDAGMYKLYDDRAVGVEKNTGRLLSDPSVIKAMLERRAALIIAYSEDEPRDDHGKWTTAGADRTQWPAHIQALKIPPAWKDVRYSTDPKASLLAVGKDVKGRDQYVYSQEFKNSQADLKFERVQALAKEIAGIDKQIAAHQQQDDDDKLKQHADAMALIRATGIRPGSESDTQAKVKAYGATTLEGRHVRVSSKGNVNLNFVGKKGVGNNLPVTDPQVAAMLVMRKADAGNSGQIFPNVTASSLRDYVHSQLDNGGFSTKDFRTLLGTSTAQSLVSSMKAPSDPKSYAKAVKSVASAVAEKLGNTASVALSSYIAPQVFSGWKMHAGVTAAAFQFPKVYYGNVTNANTDFRDRAALFDDDDTDEMDSDDSVEKMLGLNPAEIKASASAIDKIRALPNADRPTGKWDTLRRAKEGKYGVGQWKQNPLTRISKPPDAQAFKELPVKLRDHLVDTAPIEHFDPHDLKSNQPVVLQSELEHFAKHGSDPEPVVVLKTKMGLYVHNGNHRSTLALLSGKKVKARYVDLSKVKEIEAYKMRDNDGVWIDDNTLGDERKNAAKAVQADFDESKHPRDNHGRFTLGDTNTDQTSWHFDDFHQGTKINGVPLQHVSNPDFSKLTDPSLKEQPLKVSQFQHAAAGVVMIEPDGKVWVTTPDNYFGDYRNTFPKGTVESGESLQQAAVRETYEESGLLAKITGVLGDVNRSTSATRYYIGERVGGHPAMAGPETYAVKLMDPADPATADRLRDIKGRQTADAKVLQMVRDHLGISQSQPAPDASVLPASVVMGEKLSGPKGSNPGGIYKGTDGVDRYVKMYDNPERVHGEVLANTIYNDLGVKAPVSSIVAFANGKEGFASQIISGGKTLEATGLTKDNAREVLKGFAADVLTANWDSVGLTYDNILLKGGQAIRVDNGASFLYRAQGSSKPAALLNQATEIEGFFNPAVNREYAKLVQKAGYASAQDIPGFQSQVKAITGLQKSSGGWGKYLESKAPYLGSQERSKITNMLSARTKALSDAAGISARASAMAAQLSEDVFAEAVDDIFGGGPGSGWYADNGHISHLTPKEKGMKLQKMGFYHFEEQTDENGNPTKEVWVHNTGLSSVYVSKYNTTNPANANLRKFEVYKVSQSGNSAKVFTGHQFSKVVDKLTNTPAAVSPPVSTQPSAKPAQSTPPPTPKPAPSTPPPTPKPAPSTAPMQPSVPANNKNKALQYAGFQVTKSGIMPAGNPDNGGKAYDTWTHPVTGDEVRIVAIDPTHSSWTYLPSKAGVSSQSGKYVDDLKKAIATGGETSSPSTTSAPPMAETIPVDKEWWNKLNKAVDDNWTKGSTSANDYRPDGSGFYGKVAAAMGVPFSKVQDLAAKISDWQSGTTSKDGNPVGAWYQGVIDNVFGIEGADRVHPGAAIDYAHTQKWLSENGVPNGGTLARAYKGNSTEEGMAAQVSLLNTLYNIQKLHGDKADTGFEIPFKTYGAEGFSSNPGWGEKGQFTNEKGAIVVKNNIDPRYIMGGKKISTSMWAHYGSEQEYAVAFPGSIMPINTKPGGDTTIKVYKGAADVGSSVNTKIFWAALVQLKKYGWDWKVKGKQVILTPPWVSNPAAWTAGTPERVIGTGSASSEEEAAADFMSPGVVSVRSQRHDPHPFMGKKDKRGHGIGDCPECGRPWKDKLHWRIAASFREVFRFNALGVESAAYKLAGYTSFQGLPISIENKKGSTRSGVAADGSKWSVVMPFDYGYIKGTKGADGQCVDCFIGPVKDAKFAYVVHQTTYDGSSFDEDKVMLGFKSAAAAEQAYRSAYKGVDLFHSMSVIPMHDFIRKVLATKDKKYAGGRKIHAEVV